MPDRIAGASDCATSREKALSRWDNDGGATRHGPQDGLPAEEAGRDREPQLTNAELVQLRVRVIALENLVIALLAEGSDQQVEVVREMATYISPRPGVTHHPLTTHAAAHMIDLAERAAHFRSAGLDEWTSDPRADPHG
ncbi:MAG TPA: hypothetical protein VIJ94_07145 [Caulobacteraceae bacterium]